jgi:hypothetical protein
MENTLVYFDYKLFCTNIASKGENNPLCYFLKCHLFSKKRKMERGVGDITTGNDCEMIQKTDDVRSKDSSKASKRKREDICGTNSPM